MTAFLPPRHPGQSDTLVHFCGRGRPSASPGVADLSARERLGGILSEERIRAFAPFGGVQPVVSFSESDTGGVEAMFSAAGWEPWGVIVKRDWVWAAGGGPVWYTWEDMYESAKLALGAENESWLVRTTPQESDWLHEREWRIPCRSGEPDPGLDLSVGGLVAILVGDPEWEPPFVTQLEVSPYSGDPALADMTPHVALVPRWLWNGHNIEDLEPVGFRIEYWPE